MQPRRPGNGFSFYTEFRGRGRPEDVICEFCRSARALLDRQVEDLRSDRYGKYGGHTRRVMQTLGGLTERVKGHIDVFEQTAIQPTDDPETASIGRNIVANVLADSGFSELAQSRIETPAARESKFDQGLGGKIIEEMPDIAEKVEVLFEGVAKVFLGEGSEPLDGAGKLLGAVLRDIGIFGKLSFGLSGGDEVGQQLENKLEAMIPGINGLIDGQTTLKETTRVTRESVERIDDEVGFIERKADTLGGLLGETLVGRPWIVDPRASRTEPNQVPKRSVKEEIHYIECLLEQFFEVVVGEPFRKPAGPTPLGPSRVRSPAGGGSPVSPIVESPGSPGSPDSPFSPRLDSPPPPPPLLGPLIKKIFVWEEDVFTPTAATDERLVLVETPAFDLAGWLDLTTLRPGDRVETELLVSIAGQPYRLFRATSFTRPGIYPFSALASGENKVSGTDIQIILRQTVSSDAFATPIPIGYQFIVESQ